MIVHTRFGTLCCLMYHRYQIWGAATATVCVFFFFSISDLAEMVAVSQCSIVLFTELLPVCLFMAMLSVKSSIYDTCFEVNTPVYVWIYAHALHTCCKKNISDVSPEALKKHSLPHIALRQASLSAEGVYLHPHQLLNDKTQCCSMGHWADKGLSCVCVADLPSALSFRGRGKFYNLELQRKIFALKFSYVYQRLLGR